MRSYFDGGKVYNHVQSGSFEGRCYAEGLRFQEGPQWITHTYQEVTGQQPPQPLVDVTNNIEKRTAKDKKQKQSTQYKDGREQSNKTVVTPCRMIMEHMLLNQTFLMKNFRGCV